MARLAEAAVRKASIIGNTLAWDTQATDKYNAHTHEEKSMASALVVNIPGLDTDG
jgi:hypothetical protein